MSVDQVAKSAQVDLIAATVGLTSVDVAVAQNLVRVAECMEDHALAGAVAPEEKRDGPQVNPDRAADPLKFSISTAVISGDFR